MQDSITDDYEHVKNIYLQFTWKHVFWQVDLFSNNNGLQIREIFNETILGLTQRYKIAFAFTFLNNYNVLYEMRRHSYLESDTWVSSL